MHRIAASDRWAGRVAPPKADLSLRDSPFKAIPGGDDEVLPMPPPQLLDCRDLKCPMPIVRLAMAIRSAAVGDEVVVEATDPAFLADVRAWSRMTGHAIEREVDGAVKQAVIRKVQS